MAGDGVIATFAEQVSGYLEDAKDEYVSSLEDLQSVIQTLGWVGLPTETYIEEIADITFNSFNNAKSLIGSVEFIPVEERALFEDGEISITHVFESTTLDSVEASLASLISNAGEGKLKSLNSALIDPQSLTSLISGYSKQDTTDRNRFTVLMNAYVSPDSTGNEAWLDQRFDWKLSDREKLAFTGLFKLAQESAQWASERNLSIEDMHMDFTAKYASLLFTMTKANIAAYNAEVEANIAALEANVKTVKAQIDVASIALDRDSSQFSLEVKQANSRMANYVKRYNDALNYNLTLLSARVAGDKNIADGYKALTVSYAQKYSSLSMGEV